MLKVTRDDVLMEGHLVNTNSMHQVLLIARDRTTTKVVRDYLKQELVVAISHLRETADWVEKEMKRLP